MNYTTLHYKLQSIFDIDKDYIEIENSPVCIQNLNFHSEPWQEDLGYEYSSATYKAFTGFNSLEYQNQHFRVPVFNLKNTPESEDAIILLHGLNERKWDKYLSWAYELVIRTGKPVILFPIAYHMNRAPFSWNDPRQMQSFVQARHKQLPGIKELSVANIALSERLSLNPEDFFFSGYQSVKDIFQFIQNTRNESYSFLSSNSTFNFFSYSIGAFISEILLLSDNQEYLTDSKFFFYCGGSTFSEINGNSKYILDSRAIDKLRVFYLKNLKLELKRDSAFSNLVKYSEAGQAFRNLLDTKNIKKIPRRIYKRISEQIEVVALKADQVITFNGLKKTLCKSPIKLFDFDFNYSHYMPFPLVKGSESEKVDMAFDKVFDLAARQLC